MVSTKGLWFGSQRSFDPLQMEPHKASSARDASINSVLGLIGTCGAIRNSSAVSPVAVISAAKLASMDCVACVPPVSLLLG
jgi:hypothetical protein